MSSSINIKRTIIAFVAGAVILTGIIVLSGLPFASHAATPYQLPNDNAGCPGNCREIPWNAGSDLWNGGALPSYTPVTCTGLAGNGSTDDGPAIQSCINNASPNTAVVIPAGTYYVNSMLNMKSNVVLRGVLTSGPPYLPSANPAATTLKLGGSGGISFPGGSRGSNVAISSGYTKGSTQITMSGGSYSVGDFIVISENPDPTLATANGSGGTCRWCGEADAQHLMDQIVQITAVNGSTLTLNRPLYYTLQASLSPVAEKVTMGVAKAGVENIRMDGSYADHTSFILMHYAAYDWVKGVETYDAGTLSSNNFSPHISLQWTYGDEVRDSYLHYGRSTASSMDYGIDFLYPNSDDKVENNVMRHHRHAIALEGGTSGSVFLYNYIDDNYTESDWTYLGSARATHGSHPFMNLFEGNVISHITADQVWGSSSHEAFFRNWLWGDETGQGVPNFPPSGGYDAVDVHALNTYFSFVGNVLGNPYLHSNWSNATLDGTDHYASPSHPIVYSFDTGSSGSIPSPRTTAILHGNYDFKTKGVAYWDGGSNHTLANSLYYSSKPAFLGSCAWPAFGPDLSPITSTIPAVARYNGSSACGSGGTTSDTTPPSQPELPGVLYHGQGESLHHSFGL